MLGNNDQNIEDFLSGNMPEETQREFEKAMSDDPGLAEAVSQHKTTLKIIDAFGDLEIMEEIKAVHQEEMARKGKIKKIRFWQYAVAASVTILLLCGIWHWQDSDSPAELYAEYYSAYPLSFTDRSENSIGEQLASDDLFYKSGKFDEAIPLFENNLSNIDQLSKIKLAIGICKMEIDEHESALLMFNDILQNEFDLYQDHALWYSALSNLHLGKKELAKEQLMVIIQKKRSVFNEKANNLISSF